MWDYDDLMDSEGKSYMLRFLPYLETPEGRPVEEIIGYIPPRRRGYGYGRWEEFFRTLDEARKRMAFLISERVIEDAELRKEVKGQRMATTLVDEWQDDESTEED